MITIHVSLCKQTQLTIQDALPHVAQVQQKPTHAYCKADKHIRGKALLYGGHCLLSGQNGTTVL